MANQKTDVVLVGVGASGGIIAAELAKTGAKVIGLERGPRLETQDFQNHDELRYFQRRGLRPDPKVSPLTWRPNADSKATPVATVNAGYGVGGGSVHYGGLSWRFHEDDFRVRSKTIEHYGASAVPEDSSLIDWPVSYAEMEPYYDHAEYDLGISGKAGNVKGQKMPGGNPFEGARSREYPLPPLFKTQADGVFETGANSLGYHPFPSPRAIISEAYNGRPGCTYCGFCQVFGCHVGAKSSTLVTKIPEADATGNFKLITGTMVYRINTDNSGRATGVSYYGQDGSDNTIEADLVIMSAYVYDNARLLLLSKTDKFQNGLANSSDMVGRNFMAHMGARAYAAFDKRYVNEYMGPSNQKHTIDDFNADNFDHSGLGFIRGAQISTSSAALDAGPIGTAMDMAPPPGTPTWGAQYRDFIAQYFARYTCINGQIENLPYPDQRLDLDPNVKDHWGLPAPRITYDWRRPNEMKRVEFIRKKVEEIAHASGADKVWVSGAGRGNPGGHHQGTVRMGSNPKESVVNKYGQTWDIPNLFVVGSSQFPSMGAGFNPTLSLEAFAYMTAEAITSKYMKNPGPLIQA